MRNAGRYGERLNTPLTTVYLTSWGAALAGIILIIRSANYKAYRGSLVLFVLTILLNVVGLIWVLRRHFFSIAS